MSRISAIKFAGIRLVCSFLQFCTLVALIAANRQMSQPIRLGDFYHMTFQNGGAWKQKSPMCQQQSTAKIAGDFRWRSKKKKKRAKKIMQGKRTSNKIRAKKKAKKRKVMHLQKKILDKQQVKKSCKMKHPTPPTTHHFSPWRPLSVSVGLWWIRTLESFGHVRFITYIQPFRQRCKTEEAGYVLEMFSLGSLWFCWFKKFICLFVLLFLLFFSPNHLKPEAFGEFLTQISANAARLDLYWGASDYVRIERLFSRLAPISDTSHARNYILKFTVRLYSSLPCPSAIPFLIFSF